MFGGFFDKALGVNGQGAVVRTISAKKSRRRAPAFRLPPVSAVAPVPASPRIAVRIPHRGKILQHLFKSGTRSFAFRIAELQLGKSLSYF